MHLSAAVLLFVHLWLAIVGQGWDWMPQATAQSPARRQLYRAVAVAMVVGVVVAVGLGVAAAVFNFALPTLVLWIERYEIACFAVYWVSELVRFWGIDDTAGRAPVPTGVDAPAN